MPKMYIAVFETGRDYEGTASVMSIPLIDLRAQYRSIRAEIDQAIHGVLESGTFILGPNVTSFEQEVSEYLGVKYAIGVASGTDALLLTLRAYGIGAEDEVIVPTYTFFAKNPGDRR